jgi:ankyrin repeat protein
MSELLTSEESKGLIALCRAGKLYEVDKWITSGKSIQTPPEIRKTPLHIAIDLGFHSLVELLARHESRQEAKNQALSHAVSEKRLDFVELLVAHGAQANSIPLADVLLNWEPAMIRFFLENGADVVTGAPFAVAFREKIRTALRPFVEYKKTHSDLATQLQEQADRALRHFCYEGDLKWVSLLLWAGASPRTRGPTLDERWADDPECHTTALREACTKGNLEILKKLKPDPHVDDVSELLSSAALATSKELIDYLVALGATPNDKENGGSSALDHCFWNLGFANINAFLNKRPLTRYDVSETFECIQLLVAHGALWRPEARTGLNSLRQTLYKCEPIVTVDLLKLLARHQSRSGRNPGTAAGCAADETTSFNAGHEAFREFPGSPEAAGVSITFGLLSELHCLGTQWYSVLR